jgi:hypothetical protein
MSDNDEKTEKVDFGSKWRVLARDGDREVTLENEGVFDELVIDNWLHLEQMTDTSYWMRVGDARISIVRASDGNVVVTVERDIY